MNDHEKSHERVVPTKPGNKTAKAEADSVEGRRSTAENLSQRNANRTQNRGNAPSGLERVREVARRDKGILHPYPDKRFDVRIGGRNRMR